jgi:F420-dependent oxidoreductase-like protein
MGSEGRPLRFGIQLQAQRTTWQEYLRAVKEVEELGFDSVWNFDHMLPFAGADDSPCFETLTTLAAMASLTERIRIGSLVNGVLYRDPATLAKSAATVDQISDGRLEFSLGAAWAEREFRAYGIDFPAAPERQARLDEALQIVKLLWSEHRSTFTGRYYRVDDAPCSPKPVQAPHPPIWIGGMGPGTLRIAAKHADNWNAIGTVEHCQEKLALLHGFCHEIGRDPAEIEVSIHGGLGVAATHQAAVDIGRAALAAVDRHSLDELSSWMLGTPTEVIATMQRHIALGATNWVMAIGAPFDMVQLGLFMKEVVPALRP